MHTQDIRTSTAIECQGRKRVSVVDQRIDAIVTVESYAAHPIRIRNQHIIISATIERQCRHYVIVLQRVIISSTGKQQRRDFTVVHKHIIIGSTRECQGSQRTVVDQSILTVVGRHSNRYQIATAVKLPVTHEVQCGHAAPVGQRVVISAATDQKSRNRAGILQNVVIGTTAKSQIQNRSRRCVHKHIIIRTTLKTQARNIDAGVLQSIVVGTTGKDQPGYSTSIIQQQIISVPADKLQISRIHCS